LECLALKDVAKFNGHFVYLLPLGICYGHSVHFGIFSRFGMLYQAKSGNPASLNRKKHYGRK
jgi:hypothetical protein